MTLSLTLYAEIWTLSSNTSSLSNLLSGGNFSSNVTPTLLNSWPSLVTIVILWVLRALSVLRAAKSFLSETYLLETRQLSAELSKAKVHARRFFEICEHERKKNFCWHDRKTEWKFVGESSWWREIIRQSVMCVLVGCSTLIVSREREWRFWWKN